MENISNVIGIVGVLVILLAYLFLQIEKWHPQSLPYLVTNVIGAGLIVFSLLFDWNLPAFVMEVLWIIISIAGIIRLLSK